MISIIIPVYNEEKRIEQTLHILMNYIKNRFNRYEIIIVDDGSTDKTLQLLQKFIEYSEIKVVMNKQNLGKGAAVRNGVLNAEGEYIYFTDADLSTPIEELEKFLSYIKDYD
ncbi:MAG: glycosyltransferase, partial [Elusimicrobiota bacterium]|nr:glycosyltransferase [Endomicrobiia bacterium]MDW8166485.1 glycosyltransferase [Elusimicrobiota bacterium]